MSIEENQNELIAQGLERLAARVRAAPAGSVHADSDERIELIQGLFGSEPMPSSRHVRIGIHFANITVTGV